MRKHVLAVAVIGAFVSPALALTSGITTSRGFSLTGTKSPACGWMRRAQTTKNKAAA
jgi:hypothetical protein